VSSRSGVVLVAQTAICFFTLRHTGGTLNVWLKMPTNLKEQNIASKPDACVWFHSFASGIVRASSNAHYVRCLVVDATNETTPLVSVSWLVGWLVRA